MLLDWYVHYKSQWRVGSLEGGKGRWSVDRSSRNRMLFLSTEHIAHVLWLQVRIQRRTFTATITIRKGILWGQNFIFIYTTSLHCNNARSIFERFSDRENHGDFWIHFQSSCTLTLVEGGFSYSYKTSSKQPQYFSSSDVLTSTYPRQKQPQIVNLACTFQLRNSDSGSYLPSSFASCPYNSRRPATCLRVVSVTASLYIRGVATKVSPPTHHDWEVNITFSDAVTWIFRWVVLMRRWRLNHYRRDRWMSGGVGFKGP